MAVDAAMLADALAGVHLPERLIRVVALPDPPAGADPDPRTVPGEAVWLPLALAGRLVTSATVASRRPRVQLEDADGVPLFAGANPLAQAASLTVRWSWARGVVETQTVQDAVSLPLPPLPLLPGSRIRLVTSALQATDRWSQLRLTVADLSTGHLERELRRQLAQAAGLLPEPLAEGVTFE